MLSVKLSIDKLFPSGQIFSFLPPQCILGEWWGLSAVPLVRLGFHFTTDTFVLVSSDTVFNIFTTDERSHSLSVGSNGDTVS